MESSEILATETSERVVAPDRADRTLAGVARIFHHFGIEEAPQVSARLYAALCREIARDEELLALAALAPETQPPPNMLFAAVHHLLLHGASHPLREFYPNLAQGACGAPDDAFGAFRSFCLAHRDEIAQRIETRLTQTNVIMRTLFLLPAFAHVFECGSRRPLALIEIGCSAGLNLQWDRFSYRYMRGAGDSDPVRWGNRDARVALETQLAGPLPLPRLAEEMTVAWRRGIDLDPIDLSDPDAVLWLRALIWPEHVERHERLARAIEVFREHPPEIERGDASARLAPTIAEAPRDTTLCIYGTHTLYQFPKEALRAVFHGMQAAAAERPVYFVGCEGTGDRCSELRMIRYEGEGREKLHLANCNPHGRWMEWLAPAKGGVRAG